jgi:hypothetical protein
MDEFKAELTILLNQNRDMWPDIKLPDFYVAEYLAECLNNLNKIFREKEIYDEGWLNLTMEQDANGN